MSRTLRKSLLLLISQWSLCGIVIRPSQDFRLSPTHPVSSEAFAPDWTFVYFVLVWRFYPNVWNRTLSRTSSADSYLSVFIAHLYHLARAGHPQTILWYQNEFRIKYKTDRQARHGGNLFALRILSEFIRLSSLIGNILSREFEVAPFISPTC
jgi:hypothetical protein